MLLPPPPSAPLYSCGRGVRHAQPNEGFGKMSCNLQYIVDFGWTPQLRLKSNNPGWNLQSIPVKILPARMPMGWKSGIMGHPSLEISLPFDRLAGSLALPLNCSIYERKIR